MEWKMGTLVFCRQGNNFCQVGMPFWLSEINKYSLFLSHSFTAHSLSATPFHSSTLSTHSFTHSLCHSFTTLFFSLIDTPTLSLSYSPKHPHPLFTSLSHSPNHLHPLVLSLSFTQLLSSTLSLSFTQPVTPTLSLSHSPSHSLSLSFIYPTSLSFSVSFTQPLFLSPNHSFSLSFA